MFLEKIEAIAKQILEENPSPAHGWDHILRVKQNALTIANTYDTVDMTVLLAAVYLHDICRAEQDAQKGKGARKHAELGSICAQEILASFADITIEQKVHISDAIATHSARRGLTPQTLEAKILFDADKLEATGACGIARAFMFSGAHGAYMHNPGEALEFGDHYEYTRQDTAWREYCRKMRHLTKELYTPKGQEIAREREKIMEIFFSAMLLEAGQSLPEFLLRKGEMD